jgi:hypothetical protein
MKQLTIKNLILEINTDDQTTVHHKKNYLTISMKL